MKTFVLFLAASLACAAQQYSVRKDVQDGITVIHLRDGDHGIDVSVVPAFGNRAINMTMDGKNILYFPYAKLSDFQKRPDLDGVPFLAPWGNRLDATTYWANGKQYQLNPNLKNYGSDNHGQPMHGLLSSSSLWEVTDMGSDRQSAYVTSKLPFWKYPDLMEQWPFAQEYEMTYRLSEGALEVRTSIVNLSTEAIPVAIAFHPYYRIPDKPRDQWSAHLPVRKAVETNDKLIPTGELKPMDLPNPMPLQGRILDNGFTDLERESDGRAHFTIEAGTEKIEIMFGPKYPVAVLWEPPARRGPSSEFFCIEPMTGVTDAINLAHEGKYNGLQSVAPGTTWTESFWIRPSGF